MKRFIIRHIPTNKVYCEDEGGAYLLNPDDMLMSWGKKEDADIWMLNLSDMSEENNGLIITEDGDYPYEEFEITTL